MQNIATIILQKITLLVLLAGFFAFRAEGQQWEQFNWPNYPIDLRQVASLQNNLYVVTGGGIYRSADQGTHWQFILDYSIQDIYPHTLYVDQINNRLYYNQGLDSTSQYKLLRSNDLGTTWTNIGNLKSGVIAFIEDTIYGISYLNKVIKKVDTAPWFDVDTWPGTGLGQLFAIVAEGKHLWVATQKGIYHSPDAGSTWSIALPFYTTSQYVQMHRVDQQLVVANATTDSLYYSNDLGVTWQGISWPNLPILSSGQHLFAQDDVKRRLLQYNSATPQTWEPLDFHTQDSMEIFGVGETNGTFWIGTSPYGIVQWLPGDTHWEPYSGNLNNGHGQNFLYWRDHLFVDNGKVQTFSPDNGDTWEQRLNTSYPTKAWSNGNNDYLLALGYYDYESTIRRCPQNNRFEWTKYVALPEYVNYVEAIGDTLLGYQTYPPNNFFRSFDNGQSWATIPNTINATVRSFQGKFYARKSASLYQSIDAGSTWQIIYTFPYVIDETVSGSGFFSEHDTMFLSHPPDHLTYYSTNGGQSFDTLPTPSTAGSSVYRLRVNNGAVMLITGDSTFVYFSRDLGQSWITLPLPHNIPNWPQMLALSNQWAFNKNVLIFGGGYRYHFDGKRQVNGRVFLDLNSNGIQDPNELGLNGVTLKSKQGEVVGVTYNQGDFSLLLPQSADSLTLGNIPVHFVSSPIWQAIPAGVNPAVAFALQPEIDISDVAVHLVPGSPFKAGYPNTLYLEAENVGTLPATGDVKLRLDPLLTFLDAVPPVEGQSGDTLIWHYGNLAPVSKKQIQVQVSTAVAVPGTPLQLYAEASAVSDMNPANNAVDLTEIVQSSYDPNAKTVSETDLPVDMANGHELIYTIHFQNLGNAPTDFITVRDTLASGLDAASVRVLTASHPFEWSIEEGKILVFRFNPIALTSADADSLHSQGFVQFAVRLRSNLEVGEQITNTAHIYFDFNPAIVTNTVATTIQVVSTFEPTDASKALLLFPNPAFARATVQLPAEESGKGWIEIFSAGGRLLQRLAAEGAKASLEVSDWPAGAYWFRWTVDGKTYWGKLIIGR